MLIRTLLISIIYLASAGSLIAGSIELPTRPTQAISGDNIDEMTRKADEEYKQIILNSASFKMIVAGAAGLFFNIIIHTILRRMDRRVKRIAEIRMQALNRERYIQPILRTTRTGDPAPQPEAQPEPILSTIIQEPKPVDPIIYTLPTRHHSTVSFVLEASHPNWVEQAYLDSTPLPKAV